MRACGALVLAMALLLGCGASSGIDQTGSQQPAETATAEPVIPKATATQEPIATLEPTVTVQPVPTAVPQLTVTPEPTLTSEPTATPTPEPAVTPEPTATPTPEPAVTPEPTATPTPEPTVTPEPAVPTAPVDDGAKPDLPPSDYQGEIRALRNQNGVMLPIREVDGDSYLVVTPCYNLETVTGGLPILGGLDIVIDPGHGGDEPGAVGPNGLKESTVNLRVAELLRTEMIDRGYTVELTRYSDHRVAIQTRAELANTLAPRVFVSIHHNGGFPEPFPVAGTEVFVQLNDPESSRLGSLVFQEIQIAFADIEAEWMGNLETFGVAWRQNDEGTDLYGVLRRTPDLVSILTEAMFISTPAEADLLAMPEVLQIEALALADALDRWFETDDTGTGFTDGVIFEGDLGNGGGTEGCIDPPL